ncbi:sorbin and SH3 domain-containing protein 1-like [Rhincodon typus]|uniref:sorbin and SH3 domain-containing protein 1-like n=1 Tax=Rhincodon typus TaxID=259920 RepID=UPI00202DFC82|nr:sorbin and SH3 domain-containing protein 1-like [Rhincodon typus]
MRITSGCVEPPEADLPLIEDSRQSTSPELPSSKTAADSWMPPSAGDTNGDATSSSLAAKGFRSVRPHLPTDYKPQLQPPPIPPTPKEESFAWRPPNKVKPSYFAPVPILEYVPIRPEQLPTQKHSALPNVYIEDPSSTGSNAKSKSTICSAKVTLHVVQPVAHSNPSPQDWVLESEATLQSASWCAGPAARGSVPGRKVSNLYVPCLSRSTSSRSSRDSTCDAPEEADMPAAPATGAQLLVPATADSPPLVPCKPSLQVFLPRVKIGGAQTDDSLSEPRLQPGSAALDQEQASGMDSLRPDRQAHPTTHQSPPQRADTSSVDVQSTISEGELPCASLESHPGLVSSSRLSAYPSTTFVNPTIVLLQHNRGKQ